MIFTSIEYCFELFERMQTISLQYWSVNISCVHIKAMLTKLSRELLSSNCLADITFRKQKDSLNHLIFIYLSLYKIENLKTENRNVKSLAYQSENSNEGVEGQKGGEWPSSNFHEGPVILPICEKSGQKMQ